MDVQYSAAAGGGEFRNGWLENRIKPWAQQAVLFRNQKAKCLVGFAGTAIDGWIVIPVVVGSSPISHPKEFSSIKQLQAQSRSGM
jgi:hypothetical protein